MALTDSYSHQLKAHLDAIIRFKKSLSTEVSDVAHTDSVSYVARKVNDFGEVEACRIKQEQKRFSEDEVKMLISEYQSGKSTYALAEQFGCKRQTVSEVLKRHGVDVSCRWAQRKLDIDDIVAMYENMNTAADIAKKYDVSPKVILRCLREHDVKIRTRWDY